MHNGADGDGREGRGGTCLDNDRAVDVKTAVSKRDLERNTIYALRSVWLRSVNVTTYPCQDLTGLGDV